MYVRDRGTKCGLPEDGTLSVISVTIGTFISNYFSMRCDRTPQRNGDIKGNPHRTCLGGNKSRPIATTTGREKTVNIELSLGCAICNKIALYFFQGFIYCVL